MTCEKPEWDTHHSTLECLFRGDSQGLSTSYRINENLKTFEYFFMDVAQHCYQNMTTSKIYIALILKHCIQLLVLPAKHLSSSYNVLGNLPSSDGWTKISPEQLSIIKKIKGFLRLSGKTRQRILVNMSSAFRDSRLSDRRLNSSGRFSSP